VARATHTRSSCRPAEAPTLAWFVRNGLERDHVSLAWGRRITVRVAEQSLRIVVG
jgi:hypothetical protein